MANLRDLAAALAPRPERTPVPVYRQAVISDVAAGPPATVSVLLGGEGTAIPGVRYVAGLAPQVGQTVWILVLGKDLLVVFRLE